MNKNINFVTIPRSGHHLVIRILQKYFNNELDYCEFYTCCCTTPCSLFKNIQKNHDFNLKLQYKVFNLYVIQYRNFLESAISDFNLRIKNNNFKNDLEFVNILKKTEGYIDNIECTKESWDRHLIWYSKYYVKFYKKWILNSSPYIKIDYKNLINNPKTVLKKLIIYLFPDKKINENKLDEIISDEKISAKNKIENFIFFNKNEFKKIEEKIEKLIYT